MEKDFGLSDLLSEFARTLITDFPIQAILDRVVVRIVETLPVDAAGLTLISQDTKPQYIAASDELALCMWHDDEPKDSTVSRSCAV